MKMIRLLLATSPFVMWVIDTAGVAPALANPAIELCVKDGATIAVETAPSGAQHNVCVFPSGARINEWAYFRNKHRTTH